MVDLRRFTGQRIAILGLGRTGLAAARALTRAGAEVLAWDDAGTAQAAATAAGIALTDLGKVAVAGIDALVLSPGIPHRFPQPNPTVARLQQAGVPVIGDIDLLYRAEPAPRYVGITGTNGKSTTTTLIDHIVAGTGRPHAVGGNLGPAVLDFPSLPDTGVYVIEMSSYQLELTPSVAFDIAVLLNISPDHLARHGGMDGYVAAKNLVFRQPDGIEPRLRTAVVGVDDPWCRTLCDGLRATGRWRVVPISVETAVPGGVYAPDGILIDDSDDTAETICDLRPFARLPGRHNWQNAAAAYVAARALGIARADIVASLESFPGLEHRQQWLATIDGVRFVNDSKATNADAAAKALVCYEPIYWIIGGRAKESGLDGLEPFMPRIRHAFLIGEATERFATWLDGKIPYSRCGDLATATRAAYALARQERLAGATVLLSPACASWDQFPNFEVRGEAFAAHVRNIAAGDAP
ncbi:MAG: UDP-N-acetylmuramoyl-L-alanine--D-glutamate ligase [Azospirillaceae bacterium]|nr:UDP-N-acetylmuramoyl-L-alanine--D-glutamate ligase [Azospirillaceae bacterium]